MLETTQALLHISYLKGKQWYEDPSHIRHIQRYKDPFSFWAQMYSLVFDPPSLITNGIFLGNAMNASCKSVLTEHKIEAILNISQELPNFFSDQYRYLKVSVKDLPSESLRREFDRCYLFIKQMEEENRNILIHCYAGASRSAAVTAYYLMREKHMSLEEAIKLLERERPIVNMNQSFIRELEPLTFPLDVHPS